MLTPEVPDLRDVGADDNPGPNIADDGQQVFHTGSGAPVAHVLAGSSGHRNDVPPLSLTMGREAPEEGLMGDTKQKEEQNEPKKPIGEQVTDFIAAGAGALAENAIQSVAKSVRKVAAKKTPKPVEDAVNSV